MAIVTDLARVKTWMGMTSAEEDARLDQIIRSVDAQFEAHVRRPLVRADRIEVLDVRPYQRVFVLAATPIVELTSLRHDATRVWDEDSEVGAADYYLDMIAGTIELDAHGGTFGPGSRVLQAAYMGGLATTVSELEVIHPQVVHWAAVQVSEEYRRRNTPGSSSESGPNTGSKIFTGPLELLQGAKVALAPLRRVRLGR